VFALAHVSDTSDIISDASAPPVDIVTFPEARRVSNWLTFRTAVAAVGVQTPAEQDMLEVGSLEMDTAACAGAAMKSADAPARIAKCLRIFIPSLP
jgi:hypothetical protein